MNNLCRQQRSCSKQRCGGLTPKWAGSSACNEMATTEKFTIAAMAPVSKSTVRAIAQLKRASIIKFSESDIEKLEQTFARKF